MRQAVARDASGGRAARGQLLSLRARPMNSTSVMTILEVVALRKLFPIRKGLLRRVIGHVRAVDGVSFHIEKGETLSLVGESGCGKTTVSRCIVRALRPTAGEIRFQVPERGMVDLVPLGKRALRPWRRHLQMIFQDPYSSLNPRMTIG